MIWREFYDHLPPAALPIYELEWGEPSHIQAFVVEGDMVGGNRVRWIPGENYSNRTGRISLPWTTRPNPNEVRTILEEVRRTAPTGYLFVAYRENGFAGFVHMARECWLTLVGADEMLPPEWLASPTQEPEPEPLRLTSWERLLG